jgi:hypothetical protein
MPEIPLNRQMWAAGFIFKHMRIDLKVTQELWYVKTLCTKKQPWQHDSMLPTLLQWFYSLDLSEETHRRAKGQCAI